MHFYSLPYRNKDNFYYLCPTSGNLLIKDLKQIDKLDSIPDKIKKLKLLVDNPFLLKCNKHTFDYRFLNFTKITRKANILISISKLHFLFARIYASFNCHSFRDSADAIEYFHSISPKDDINKLCLPRTLFSAKTSAAFKEHGVIFIGVFLPSRSMHAWIIEKGIQPDQRDDIWHQYRPIAAIG